MKTFIVMQMQIDSYINSNYMMSNVVRRIEAKNEEIAIGKFVIATQDIKAYKKLNIECYDLNKLKSV